MSRWEQGPTNELPASGCADGRLVAVVELDGSVRIANDRDGLRWWVTISPGVHSHEKVVQALKQVRQQVNLAIGGANGVPDCIHVTHKPRKPPSREESTKASHQETHSLPVALTEDWIDQNHSPLGSRRHRRLVNEGQIPGRRVGKMVFVHRSDLDAYILAHGPHGRARTVGATDDVEQELKALGLGGWL